MLAKCWNDFYVDVGLKKDGHHSAMPILYSLGCSHADYHLSRGVNDLGVL